MRNGLLLPVMARQQCSRQGKKSATLSNGRLNGADTFRSRFRCAAMTNTTVTSEPPKKGPHENPAMRKE